MYDVVAGIWVLGPGRRPPPGARRGRLVDRIELYVMVSYIFAGAVEGDQRPAVKAIVISVVGGGMGFVLWMGQVCTLQSGGDWNMAVSLAPDVHQ